MSDRNDNDKAVIPVPPPPNLRPLVGVGVVVVRPTDNKIYVGVRKGSHGATKWALPGGHLEWGESWADCAAREGAGGETTAGWPHQKPLCPSYRFLVSHLLFVVYYSLFSVEEEMGIALTDVQFLHATNDVMTFEQKHYVTIFMGGRPRDNDTAIPRNLEPHKCEGEWQALNVDELCEMVGQDQLFLPLEQLLRQRPASLAQYINNNSNNNKKAYASSEAAVAAKTTSS
jgi:8-oxo-dGTP diphosphatase